MTNNFPLRARSKCGNFLVPFTLADGPCPVDKDHFVLSERPNTPILRYDSILRGFDIEGLFEGDIITLDTDVQKREYIVLFSAGLKLVDLETREEFYFYNDGKYTHVSNIYNRGVEFIKRSEPKFKLNNTFFFLSVVYGMYEGYLLVNNELLKVRPEDIQQYSGVRDSQSKHIYFGDNGLTMHNGRLGVFEDGKFLDLLNGEVTKEELQLWKK